MRRRQSLRANAELNLVNIIDVIFAILVVFMITAPLATQGVTVDLPRAPAPSVDEQKTLEITVTRQREVFIGKGVSSLRDFERDFRVAFDGDPETAILVRADRAVPYGIVMEIVSAVNRQGGRKLGFLTSPEAQDSGTSPAPVSAVPGRP